MSKHNSLAVEFSRSEGFSSIACSTACSGSYYNGPIDHRALLMPEPIYETCIVNKDNPVSTLKEDEVAVMQLQDFDPNKPLIDVDRFTEEQHINRQLALQADARLAAFMHGCRQLRESHPDDAPEAIEAFVNTLIDLYFDGRSPLPTTQRHSTTMKLVLKAELVNLIASHDPTRR